MLWCWLLLLFYLTGGFSSFIAFQRHPSFFRDLSPGFYTHFILSAQLIAEWFVKLSFNFSGLFCHSLTASATVLRGAFFTHRSFLPCTPSPHFGTFCDLGTPHPGSPSVPVLRKLSLPADPWSRTTQTRPLVYQLHQWATKYKVTKLLNMFQPSYAFSKSYGKDYKQDLLISTA